MVLICVHSFALNRMDILQRHGRYPVPPDASKILGVELSGIVEAVGDGVKDLEVGNSVFALVSGGAYAQYCLAPAEMCIKKPASLTYSQAASIPEAWFTAYKALVLVGQIKAGDNVLIHAAASGVGIAAIQIAKHAGAIVFATAGSNEKLQFCKKFGADFGINYKQDEFAKIVHKETHGYGVDLIVDPVGANYWEQNIDSLAMDGRLVLLGLLSGGMVEKFNIAPFLAKRLKVEGTTLRSRSLEYQLELRNHFVKEVLPLIADATFKLAIDIEYDWHQIKEAHEYMEANKNIGKIVVNIK